MGRISPFRRPRGPCTGVEKLVSPFFVIEKFLGGFFLPGTLEYITPKEKYYRNQAVSNFCFFPKLGQNWKKGSAFGHLTYVPGLGGTCWYILARSALLHLKSNITPHVPARLKSRWSRSRSSKVQGPGTFPGLALLSKVCYISFIKGHHGN